MFFSRRRFDNNRNRSSDGDEDDEDNCGSGFGWCYNAEREDDDGDDDFWCQGPGRRKRKGKQKKRYSDDDENENDKAIYRRLLNGDYDVDSNGPAEFDIANPGGHEPTKRPLFSYEMPSPEKKRSLFQLSLPTKPKTKQQKPSAKPKQSPNVKVVETPTTITAGPANLFTRKAVTPLSKTSKTLEVQQRVAAAYKKNYGGLDAWTSMMSAKQKDPALRCKTVLQDIPDHVILNIIRFVSPRDIIEVRTVNHNFYISFPLLRCHFAL